MSALKMHPHWLVWIAAGLLAIWPLPNSIALRHVLLIAGLFFALNVLIQAKQKILHKDSWPLALVLGFFLWLLFHFFLLATNTEEQLYELRGDWLRAFFASIIGIATGVALTQTDDRKTQKYYENIFIAGLAGTVAIYLIRYVWEVYQTSEWIHRDFFMEPYLGKTALVVFGGVFLCGIFAKLSTRLGVNDRIIWNPIAAVAILCVGITYYFSNTKNGFLVLIFILGIYALKLLRSWTKSSTSSKLVLLVALIAFLSLLKSHIEVNPSWLNFYADVKTGVDLKNNQNWKNAAKYPLPTNENGVTANSSTYERSAWATAGAILAAENPLGYGLINHSFGALALQKWDDFYKPIGKYRRASHSGWLDFTLGFGFPGLLLVLIPMLVSYLRARNRHDFWFEFVRWSVPVVVVIFTITEVSTGHFIEFLFFYIALISAITIKKRTTSSDALNAEKTSDS